MKHVNKSPQIKKNPILELEVKKHDLDYVKKKYLDDFEVITESDQWKEEIIKMYPENHRAAKRA